MLPHRTDAELAAALDAIRAAPRDTGTVALIAARPAVGLRTLLDEAQLALDVGLVGDSWATRQTAKWPQPNPDAQLTLMSARAVAVLAEDPADWALAGDQLYVDYDLSAARMTPGTRLAIGGAVVEVTAEPHTGCAKFTARFGAAATRWVSSPDGRALNLRGINTRVVVAGTVRRGDAIRAVMLRA